MTAQDSHPSGREKGSSLLPRRCPEFNPWWRGEPIADLPKWRRAAFREFHAWMTAPPRAVLLSGARQVGKTTLLLQVTEVLLRAGVPAANILYAIELCRARRVARGYVVTKALDDFGPVADLPDTAARILRIPAPLLCYWMGATE